MGTLVQVRSGENPLPDIAQSARAAGYEVLSVDENRLEIRRSFSVLRQLFALGTMRYQANLSYDRRIMTGHISLRQRSLVTLLLPFHTDTCNAWVRLTMDLDEQIDSIVSWSGGEELLRECGAGYGWD